MKKLSSKTWSSGINKTKIVAGLIFGLFTANFANAGTGGTGGTYYCVTSTGEKREITLPDLLSSKMSDLGQSYDDFKELTDKINNYLPVLAEELKSVEYSNWIVLSKFKCNNLVIESDNEMTNRGFKEAISFEEKDNGIFWVKQEFLSKSFGIKDHQRESRVIALINEALRKSIYGVKNSIAAGRVANNIYNTFSKDIISPMDIENLSVDLTHEFGNASNGFYSPFERNNVGYPKDTAKKAIEYNLKMLSSINELESIVIRLGADIFHDCQNIEEDSYFKLDLENSRFICSEEPNSYLAENLHPISGEKYSELLSKIGEIKALNKIDKIMDKIEHINLASLGVRLESNGYTVGLFQKYENFEEAFKKEIASQVRTIKQNITDLKRDYNL